MEAFAEGVRDVGIRRITGTVLVDTHLFCEGYREPGTWTTVSPVAVNDNLIDIMVTAGSRVGERPSYPILPQSGYVRFIDLAITGESRSEPALDPLERAFRALAESGPVTITGTSSCGNDLSGAIPRGVTKPLLRARCSSKPSRQRALWSRGHCSDRERHLL